MRIYKHPNIINSPGQSLHGVPFNMKNNSHILSPGSAFVHQHRYKPHVDILWHWTCSSPICASLSQPQYSLPLNLRSHLRRPVHQDSIIHPSIQLSSHPTRSIHINMCSALPHTLFPPFPFKGAGKQVAASLNFSSQLKRQGADKYGSTPHDPPPRYIIFLLSSLHSPRAPALTANSSSQWSIAIAFTT